MIPWVAPQCAQFKNTLELFLLLLLLLLAGNLRQSLKSICESSAKVSPLLEAQHLPFPVSLMQEFIKHFITSSSFFGECITALCHNNDVNVPSWTGFKCSSISNECKKPLHGGISILTWFCRIVAGFVCCILRWFCGRKITVICFCEIYTYYLDMCGQVLLKVIELPFSVKLIPLSPSLKLHLPQWLSPMIYLTVVFRKVYLKADSPWSYPPLLVSFVLARCMSCVSVKTHWRDLDYTPHMFS